MPPSSSNPPSTPPPVLTGGSGMGWSGKLALLTKSAKVLWVAGGLATITIGGGSFYLVAHRAAQPEPAKPGQMTTTARSEEKKTTSKGQQTTPTTTTPTTTQQQDKTQNKTSQSTSTQSMGGSTSSGSSSGNHVPNPLKIMPLGDSITQGGVGDPATVNGYRLQLWNNLNDYTIDYVGSWQNGNSSLPDKNLNGFSGECIKTDPCHGDSSLYSQTAAWITSEQPDLVIMQGGGNDFVDPTMTEAKVETYMEDWINLVFATKPDVKIIVSGAPQWYPNYESSLQAYVTQQQNAGKPIRFVPYGSTVDTVDGTHPSLAGYVTWGNELAPKVRELFPH